MKNSKDIQRSIESYLTKNGIVCKELANKLGVSEPTVTRWKNGDSKAINNKHWVKLEPLLKSHLPEGFGKVRTIDIEKPEGLIKLESLIASLSPAKLQELEEIINKAALSLREEILKNL